MKLIVGLGNSGKEYDGTRHNVGREIVRAMSDDWHVQKKLFTEIAHVQNVAIATKRISQHDVVLAIPTTYMNDSGKAVKKLLTTYHLSPKTLLVVHDDLDLPLGTLRFSQGSGAAGQKGVQSIINALSTKDFARLRIGIAGEHRATTDAATYVLKPFAKNEMPTMRRAKQKAQKAIALYCTQDITNAMQTYNALPRRKQQECIAEKNKKTPIDG